nr:MAG TPA: hypothetical protein [Caudoviricetes sp.]
MTRPRPSYHIRRVRFGTLRYATEKPRAMAGILWLQASISL